MSEQVQGFVDLKFPAGAAVHSGVFSVITSTLGNRQHFAHRVGPVVTVACAVWSRADLDVVVAQLRTAFPNADASSELADAINASTQGEHHE